MPSHDVLLCPDVYICVAGPQLVLLDLERDSYATVELADEGEGIGERVARTLSRDIDELAPAGLVTRDPAIGVPTAVRLNIIAPGRHILEPECGRPFGLVTEQSRGLTISLRDIAEFFWAFGLATRWLRHRHMAQIVADVRERQSAIGGMACADKRLRRQVSIFCKLRPWFPQRYLCLRDSLAMALFLLRRGVQIEWVFGVQMQPFGAHCWLETEGVLLNDSLEYARQFVPIMAVKPKEYG